MTVDFRNLLGMFSFEAASLPITMSAIALQFGEHLS